MTTVTSSPAGITGRLDALAASSGPGDLSEVSSYSLDAWFDDPSVLRDEHALLAALSEAAQAGQAAVVGSTSARFPGGGVTAVLLLAESHLAVHTWPEHGLATFDLLTCGRLRGEQILAHLRAALRPVNSRISRNVRDLR